jgi:hypothetical protein
VLPRIVLRLESYLISSFCIYSLPCACVLQLVAGTDDAYRLLFQNEQGRLYICGNRNLPKPMQEALVTSYCRYHATSDETAGPSAASLKVQELYLQGRVNQEVW